VGLFYDLAAFYQSSGQPAQPQPGQPYTITVTYRQEDVPPGMDEAGLALYWWDGLVWLQEPTSQVDVAGNTITAMPGHFSLWAALAEPADSPQQIFLPVILKRR
jgi:hypothetical protein